MKRLIFLTLSTFCAGTFAQVPDYLPTDGLVAWLPLDNGVEDEGPLNNEIVNYGSGSAVNRFGQQNAARHFAAARIEISNNESLDQFKTISQWTRTSSSARQVSFKQNVYNGALQERVVLTQNFSGSNCHFGIKENCGDSWNYGNQNYEVADGEWHHFVGVIHPQETRLYIDGELISSVEITSDNETCSGGDLIIGSEWSGVNYGFQGEIDDVAVWNRPLDEEEILDLYLAPPPVLGCTDVTACNYNENAEIEDDSCDLFTCKCLNGTLWSEELGGCIVANPADINLDGCVQLNDLLDLLSAYGNCGAEEVPWQCGDPLEYQGYDYETVQIGEQCWFAENLRSKNFRNGDEIAGVQSGSDWLEADEALVSIYGQDGFGCWSYVPGGDACDEEFSLEEFGRQYNGHAVVDERGLCPVGWSTPSDQNWIEMEVAAGLNPAVAFDIGYRGEELGGVLKSTSGWAANNGNNDVGFEGKAGGKIQSSDGFCDDAGRHGTWWTSTMDGNALLMRLLAYNDPGVLRTPVPFTFGCSIRCIQDAD